MNALTHTEDSLAINKAAELEQQEPQLIETLSIDELAVREEYAACCTITK